MSQITKIQWTDRTWNPVRGCSRVSEGCRNCYAERQAVRHAGPGRPYEGLAKSTKAGPRWTGAVRFLPEKLGEPLSWRKPQRVFVNSMSDLFHEELSFEQIAAVFGVMAAAPRHTFQVLTKRPERALEWFRWVESFGDRLENTAPLGVLLHHAQKHCDHAALRRASEVFAQPWPPPNVHLGVSVEDQATADKRIPLLLRCPAAVRFVSCEPLLGPVELTRWLPQPGQRLQYPSPQDLAAPSLDWVICGGESGPGARPFDFAWARSIREQCRAAGVAFFLKQGGAVALDTDYNGFAPLDLRDKKGGDPSEWPEDLRRAREFPT